MSNSGLVRYTKLSPNFSRRTSRIDKITIHHAAGAASVETMGATFQKYGASANYGVGNDGRVALYVEEEKRAWTSSNSANDDRAVTIEVSNSGGAPNWPVGPAAYASLISLVTDICRRNGIRRLNYTGDATGNLTRHNMFAATACPGPYLQDRFSAIAAEVNRNLEALEDEDMTGEEIYRRLTEYLNSQPTSDYAKEASKRGIESGIFMDGDNDGLVDNPRGIMTRQDYAVTLDRLGLLGRKITEMEDDRK